MNGFFESASIGDMDLRNRFVRSATGLGMADGAAVTDELVERYRAVASGGVGLLITGFAYVSKKGQAIGTMMALDDTADGAGLQSLASAVHSEGAKIMAQISHTGANRLFDPGFPAEAPSAIPNRNTKVEPIAMTEADIAQAIQDFASAAKRAIAYGFDGVEISAAQEYLLSAFLSPFSNVRTDQYGGPIKNRARALFEVYRAVRDAVGSGVPVTVKINAKDYYDDGLTWEDSAWVCRELSTMGVDAINLHASGGPEFFGLFSDINEPSKEAYLEQFSKDLKSQVDCPVILTGGIRSLGVIERLSEEGAADFISMSRPHISEPDLIKKWKTGESQTARCISCNKCFFAVLQGGVAQCYQFEGAT